MGNSLWWGLLLLYAGGFISLLALEGPHRAKKSAGEQEPEPGCGSCCAGADGGCQKIQIGDGDCDKALPRNDHGFRRPTRRRPMGPSSSLITTS